MGKEVVGIRRSARLLAKNAKRGRQGNFMGNISHAAIEGKGRLAAVKIPGKGIGKLHFYSQNVLFIFLLCSI